MKSIRLFRFAMTLVVVFSAALLEALAGGIITGTITDKETNTPLKSVRIQVKGTSRGALTKSDGNYTVTDVPAGEHTMIISQIGKRTIVKEHIVVWEGKTTSDVSFAMEVPETKFDEVVVYGASKRKEKITETPAAVTVITPVEIQRAARGNQLGRALEGMTGVDVVQNGTTDFNVNTRGFNNSTNRRLLILVDGRDVALQQIGATEWNSFQLPLDEFSRIEMVRGPAAALYMVLMHSMEY
ncbi:MAG: carboxypeptidase-like regulatory domain-containing protein [Ignavibacteria bacterium]|nr:carboxypeptidase-like regulatory domain-containing protein [Ignavibacteria bacterium]